MSTGTDTSVRKHIDAKFPGFDRKGGNQNANIEKMTEVEPVTSSNPPKISLFSGEFFNNIGQLPSLAARVQTSQERSSTRGQRKTTVQSSDAV
jgi:hypothetical protein